MSTNLAASTSGQTSQAASPSATGRSFSQEAMELFDQAVEDFKLNLEHESRVNATQDEQVLVRHVEAARVTLLSSPIGKAIDIAILWLLPLGFCLWGISGDGLLKAIEGEPVEASRFLIFALGSLLLGAAAALFVKGGSIKLWFKRRANRKAIRTP